MDTSSWVLIGIFVAGGVGTVIWFFVKRVLAMTQSNAEALNSIKLDIAKCAKQEDLDALDSKMSDFQLEATKSFVSQPALMQVMTSLDRTIQQLTSAIQHNSQESRDGMRALNDRIDGLMAQRRAS